MSKDVVICGYVRSPFTPAKKGDLAKIRPDDLAAEVVKGKSISQSPGLKSWLQEGRLKSWLEEGRLKSWLDESFLWKIRF